MFPQTEQRRKVDLEELTAATDAAGLAEARALLLEYGRFVVSQPSAARFCFGSLENEAQRLPRSYHEQRGGCILARVDGEPAGFVAWRELPVLKDAWEMKRLWVRPAARGLGLGRTLTLAVLERASAAGRKAVCLDTVPEAMAAAHQLYLDLGFVACAAYNDDPIEGLAYLVKCL